MEEICRRIEQRLGILEEVVRDIEATPQCEAQAQEIASELAGVRLRFCVTISGFCAGSAELGPSLAGYDYEGDARSLARRASRIVDQLARQKLLGAPAARSIKAKCDQVCSAAEALLPPDNLDECQECSAKMTVEPSQSCMYCGSCGYIAPLVGTVFEDSQFYSQEGQKAKSGSFNPNRHYDFWWMHILALEPVEEIGDPNDPKNTAGELIIEQMRAFSKRDGKILRRLTVDDIRDMLIELNRTDLNKNAALLLKKVTGIGPPSPSEEFGEKVGQYFSRVIDIDESVRPDDKPNRYYYPYYIFKILDGILPDDDPSRRILYYIYLQGDETLRKDDLVWQQIVKQIDEIDYRATRRDLRLKYRPDE